MKVKLEQNDYSEPTIVFPHEFIKFLNWKVGDDLIIDISSIYQDQLIIHKAEA